MARDIVFHNCIDQNELLQLMWEKRKNEPSLIHLSNILTKTKGGNGKRMKAEKERALSALIPVYWEYLNRQDAIGDNNRYDTDEEIRQRVSLLNDYYRYYSDSGLDGLFTSQSKL